MLILRSFKTLGVGARLALRLKEMGIKEPSAVQKKAIPMVLKEPRKDVIIGAETGSGKTLTYLLPLLTRLTLYPCEMKDIRKPIAVIMVPNQELVKQIEKVVQQLDENVALACLTKTNAIPRRTPVLVGTPKAILQHASPKDLDCVEMIVVDEADMLLGGGFERDTKQVLGVIRNQPLADPKSNVHIANYQRDDDQVDGIASYPRQTIFKLCFLATFAYATIPSYGRLSVSEYLKKKFPSALYAITEQFHRTLPALEQRFLHVKGQDNDERQQLLLQILQEDSKIESNGSTLIFVDSVNSAKELEKFLLDQGISCRSLHKDIPREERSSILHDMKSERQIVIATDIAARGLDTLNVAHVIQYEFATNVVTHIHRIGRTARAGTSGKVTNIIGPENHLVFKEIQAAGADGALTQAFSRRRSLRKKFKKASRAPEP